MALTIKYISQPDAGRELNFADEKDEIRFGRGIDADVMFPLEMDIVSRDHFTLRRELGIYRFVVSREKPVFLNGRPVLNDQELPRSGEIQLSNSKGPRLRFERLEEGAGNIPKTQVLRSGQDIGDVVREQRSGGRKLATWLTAVTALIALVAAGVYILRGDVIDTQNQVAAVNAKVADIDAQIPKLNEALASSARGTDFAAVIAKNKESVYRVSLVTPGGMEMGTGTAWVVQMPDGAKALATNSHVADMFNELPQAPPGSSIRVTQPKPPFTQLVVTGVRKHPGYDPYNEFWAHYMTAQQRGAVQSVQIMLGYDVALLTVDKPELLGEPLKLAPKEKLEAIAAGQRLLLIGYPAENTQGTDWTRPEPTSNQGIVTANTTFFLSRSDYAENQLIQHSIPSAGGASGSPIFNLDGEVVALHNAGSYAFVTIDKDKPPVRIGSSVLVNYGQRVDLLQELIAGEADAKLATYRAQWAAAEERLSRKPEDIVTDYLTELRIMVENPDGAQKVTGPLTGKMDRWEEGLKARVAVFEVNIEKPGKYFFVGWSGDRRNVVTVLFDDKGQKIAPGIGGSFVSFIAPLPDLQPRKVYVAIIDDYNGDAGTDTRPAGDGTLEIYRLVRKGES